MAKEPKIVPFGKYELLEKIAVGGMAEIFKARTKGVGGFEKYLAIKRILPHLSENKDFIDMLINEAKIAVMLSHANIVQIYDLGKIDDSYFIAMEFIEGKDLRALMTRCDQIGMPLFIQHAIFISIEVCKGLEYAHSKQTQDVSGPKDLNIVHRDISPQNVMISYEGEVKITDFGIAKANANISETEAGVVKGKYEYMSPEQASGLPVDRRSDIFSTGIVLYEMLTGQKPFRGESDLTILERVREAKVEPPSKYNKSIPKKLEKIVLKSLARDTVDRYLSATELKDDLTRFFYSSTFNFTTSNLAAFMKSIFAEEIKLDVLSDSTGIGKRPDLGDDGRTISRIFGRPDSDRFGKGKDAKNGSSAGAPLGAISSDTSTSVGASRSETNELPESTNSRTLGGEQLGSIEDEINAILIPGKTNAGKLPVAPSAESSGTSATAARAASSTDDSRTSPIPTDGETNSKATIATPRPVTASMLLGGDAALELGMEIEMAMPTTRPPTNARPKPASDDEEEPPTEAGRGAKGGWEDADLPVTGRGNAKRLDDGDHPTQERPNRGSREESTDNFDRGNGDGNSNGNSRQDFDRPTRSSASGRGARAESTEPDDDEELPRDPDAVAPARQRESTIISDKATSSGRSVSIKVEPDSGRTDVPRAATGTGSRPSPPASTTNTGSKIPVRAVKEKVRGITVNAPDVAPSISRTNQSEVGRGADEHHETVATPAGGDTSGGTRPGAESTLIGARPASLLDERSIGRGSPAPRNGDRGEPSITGRNTPPSSTPRHNDRDTRPPSGPGVARLGPNDAEREGADMISRDYDSPAPRNSRAPHPSRTSVVSSSAVDDQSDLYPDLVDAKRSGAHPLVLVAGGAIVFLAGVLIAKLIAF